MDSTYTNNLPLSPPKRILDRLTPLSAHRTKRHNYRSYNNHGSTTPNGKIHKDRPTRSSYQSSTTTTRTRRRTLSSGEVLERVENWKSEKKLHLQSKRESIEKRLLSAQRNRNVVIEEKRESARRFSEDSKIWKRFKSKIEVGLIKDEVSGVIPVDVGGGDEVDALEIGCLAYHLKRFIFKWRFGKTLLSQPLEDYIHSSYDNIQELVQDGQLRSLVKDALRNIYHIPNPFPSVPIENVFLTSLLLLSDHINNRDEKIYEASLGNDAENQFGGYLPQWMRRVHILDDGFMKFIARRLLVLCRRLLLRFRVLVTVGHSRFHPCHLQFLKVWREYCDTFRVMQVTYLSRCLLLLCKAIDVLQSGIAVEEFVNHSGDLHIPEYDKLKLFEMRKKTLVRQLSQWRNNSGVNDHNRWCTLGVDLQERIEILLKDFEVHQGGMEKVEDSGVLIPPGFTLEKWQKYRLYKVLDAYLHNISGSQWKVNSMKTGRSLLLGDEVSSGVEGMMKRIGMASFLDDITNCSRVEESVVLSLRLFGCIGIQLSGEELEFVTMGFEHVQYEEDYFLGVQRLFNKHSGHAKLAHISSSNSLPDYLKWWRVMMVTLTGQHVDQAMERLSYREFAYTMGIHTLRRGLPVGMTLEDLKSDLCLNLRYGGRSDGACRVGIPIRTLVVEGLIESLRMKKSLPHLFGVMEDELRDLYNELAAVVGECILFCLGVSDGEVNLSVFGFLAPQVSYDVAVQSSCHKWKALVSLHMQVFSKLYDSVGI